MKRITGKKPIKKKKPIHKVRLIVMGVIIVIIITFMAIRFLPTVRKIEVVIDTKESKITEEQIISLSQIKIGDKLYKDLRSAIAQRIEENPYIQMAKIERNLSGKVTIKISQRKPAYMINYAGQYIYIDKEGYILEINSISIEKPIILGLSTDFSVLSLGNTKVRLNQKDLEKLDVVNHILSNLKNNGVENTVNSIDISDKKDFVLRLDNDGKEVHLGDGSDMNTRVLYMKKILESEAGHTGIIYINGNLDEGYVYFKEQ